MNHLWQLVLSSGLNLYKTKQQYIMNNKQLFRLGIAFLAIFSISNYCYSQNYLPYNYWTFDGPNSLADSMNRSDLDPSYYNSQYSIANSSSSGVGKCLDLNDLSTKIVASNPLPLDSGFTAEFLFKPSADANETVTFFSRRDGAVSLRFGYATFRFTTKIIPTGTTTAASDNFDIALSGTGRGSYNYYVDGNWHHLVYKYNSITGIKELWVDGQLPEGFSDTVAVSGRFAANATNQNSNACDFNTSSWYYKYSGSLDEIAVYTYSLPKNMIYKHYNEFLLNKHYSFSNSNIIPPAADPIAGQVDLNEYAPGHPSVNVDAVTQLKNFPTPRFLPGNTLRRNIPIFNPSYLGGRDILPNSVAVSRSKEIQREFVTNYNYALLVTGNTHNLSLFGDTNTFDGAWINMGNQNPTWETSAISYWPQISPTSIGKVSSDPYLKCGCLPNSSYLRNAQGQFLDRSGNVAATGKVISPEAPLDSIYFDGLTHRYYMSVLFSKMSRPLDNLFENGEIVYHYNPSGITNDPNVATAIAASGLSGKEYVGNRMRRFCDAYDSQFKTLPGMANTRFMHYQITGLPTGWNYAQTRTINTPIDGQIYSTGDVYTGNPRNWRYNAGSYNGWQSVVDSRFEELKFGDSLFSPVVSPGWSYDEERFVRPGQWLGLLKAIAMTGVDHFMTGYFTELAPPQNPDNYIWIMSLPPIAQAVSSRYQEFLRNGYLMSGDVPNSVTNLTQPGYSFKAGNFNRLVVARKHNTLNKYVVTGTTQANANVKGNAPIDDIATINLDGQVLKFNIRRQGSTYIYDNTNPAAPVFYQLDGWHEYKHPYYWSKTFDFEAELFDNAAPVKIKTSVPAGATAGDFTNYTSYIKFNNPGTVEYNFQPRGTTTATHYVWVRARSTDGTAQSFSVVMDGTNIKSVGCVQDTNWTWYRYDAASGTPLAFNNLSLQNHKLAIVCNSTKVEIERITITPNSGNYYSANVAPICTQGVSGIAIITPMSSTTFCQGDSVVLSANTGTAYLWSTGATTNSITVKSAGSYLVTVTNVSNTVSTPQTVVVNALPSNMVNTSGVTTFCSGGSVTLTAASATGTYLWSPGGQTTRAITATTAGNYSVVVTNANSCSAASANTTVTITSAGTPATVSASGTTTFCQGGSVNLTANSGSSYLWSNGATSRTITANSNGNYSVTVTYATGCNSTSPSTVVAVNAFPINGVSASGATTICSGGSVTLTSNDNNGSYLWSPGGQTTKSITVTTAGNYSVVVTGSGNCSVTSPATVVSVSGVATPATITPSGPTTFCQGSNINLTANPGNSYLWSNGETTSSIVASASGNYLVTVNYAGGCNATSSATAISVNPVPTNGVTASGPTTFCNGSSVTLTANSTTGSYLWSPGGQTTRSITATSNGNYSVVITGTGNCSSTSSSTPVTVNGSGTPATVSASGSTTLCQGSNVNLTANLGNSYLWSNGATSSSIVASTSGNYSVTVSYVGGCTSTSPATIVTVNPTPSNVVTASGPITFCSGSSVSLTAANATGSYLWSPGGQTTRSINVNSAGNYSVVVTGSGNCSSTSSVTNVVVNANTPASISASGTTTFCQGGSVNLTANSGSNYQWSNGATTRTISANSTANYSVIVTNILGCTSVSSSTTVTSNPIPSNVVTASGPTSFCNGGSVTLTSNSANGNYLWSNGATSKSIIVNTAGNYSVIVNSLNCSATSSPINVIVSTGSLATPTVTSNNGNNFLCDGNTMVLTSTLATNYLWSNGATTRSITISTGGGYSVTTSNTTGCSATSSALNINLQPRPSFSITASGPLAFCAGGSVTFVVSQSIGQSYVWYNNNIQIPGANSSNYTVTTAGDYRVRVQKNGCAKNSGTGRVTIPCREGETIDGMFDLQASVYPNPFGTQATIAFTLPGDDQVTVKIYNMEGRLIDVLADRTDFMGGPIELKYDATNLGGGLYFATITTGSYGTKTIKMSSLK